MQKNGTLLIRRFSPSDSGTYECVLTNFAGRTSAKLFIDLPIINKTNNLKINLLKAKSTNNKLSGETNLFNFSAFFF